MLKKEIAPRFKNEKLAIHWQVDNTKESFDRLFYYLNVKTNTGPYFEEALAHLNLDDDRFREGLIVADIGAGICWSSAILAKHPKIKLVYAIDPSDNRLKHGKFVVRHFAVENKVKIMNGTFLKPNIPEKVDLILLCGSLHHCFEEYIGGLFSNMKRLLKPTGEILITSEHYIDWIWTIKRLLGYFYHFRHRSTLGYSLSNFRAPDPFSGDHWRTRRELERMFNGNGFKAEFFIYKGLFGKDEFSFSAGIGWHCYCAILRRK